MNLLIFGASITWGAWDKEGGWAQRIKSYFDNKKINGEYPNEYVAVYCLGVSGDNTFDLLERFETEVKARIDPEEKTLVLIEIGINDSLFSLAEERHLVSVEDYKQNLTKLISKTKELGSDLILVGLTPVDSRVNPIPWVPGKTYKLEFIKQYEEILKATASENNIPFIEVMSKFPESRYPELLSDGVHPNTEGHQIIYEEVKDYLEKRGLI